MKASSTTWAAVERNAGRAGRLPTAVQLILGILRVSSFSYWGTQGDVPYCTVLYGDVMYIEWNGMTCMQIYMHV